MVMCLCTSVDSSDKLAQEDLLADKTFDQQPAAKSMLLNSLYAKSNLKE